MSGIRERQTSTPLLSHGMRRRLAMSGSTGRFMQPGGLGGALGGIGGDGRKLPGRSSPGGVGGNQPPKTPGPGSTPSPGSPPKYHDQAPGTGDTGAWRSYGPGVSRTGQRGFLSAGAGAWSRQGRRADGPPPEGIRARPPMGPGRTGLGATPTHSGFANAQRLAQAAATGRQAPGGFTPRFDWEEVLAQRQGATHQKGGLQTATSGAGLSQGGSIDPGETRADQRPTERDGGPAVASSSAGLSGGEGEGEAGEDTRSLDQWNDDWVGDPENAALIEEWGQAFPGRDRDISLQALAAHYGLRVPDYINLALGRGVSEEGALQVLHDQWASHGVPPGREGLNELARRSGLSVDQVLAIYMSGGVLVGPANDGNWYAGQYAAHDEDGDLGMGSAMSVDSYLNTHVQTLHEAREAVAREEGFHDYGEGRSNDPFAEFFDRLAAQEVPQFDEGAVEDLIRAQQREADLRNAQAMRAAMATGGRANVAPEAALGQGQELMQQAGVNAANIRAQQQMQAEIQNFQAQIRHYQNQIDGFRMAAQHSSNAELQAQAAAQAQRLARIQGQIQQQLMQRQWQLQNTFGLQTGLDLFGDLGGALLGGALSGAF